LAGTKPGDLSADAVHSEVEGKLWMLDPEAFLYFLPAFLHLGVVCYDRLVTFVAELVDALTEPTRDDIVEMLDSIAEIPPGIGLAPETLQELRRQQLMWFDSGGPVATYRERISALSAGERAAVLEFLETIRDAHGEDFPHDELQIAIDRLNR
jgi:hypothetical protein